MNNFQYILGPIVLSCAGLLAFSTTDAIAGSKVEVSKRDCQRLVRKTGTAGAAYKPGVDARGRKVAGADLNGGSPIKLPDTLSFDVSTDLGNLTGKSIGGGKVSDSKVGAVKYDFKSGQMTFNGKPIGNRAEAELSAKCQKVLSGR
ncbi:MAG: hypothetical protein HQ503_11990 [Rhodospirillales bacterium]|nr:hypothetical protein [Rhodospirillales bacterium]